MTNNEGDKGPINPRTISMKDLIAQNLSPEQLRQLVMTPMRAEDLRRRRILPASTSDVSPTPSGTRIVNTDAQPALPPAKPESAAIPMDDFVAQWGREIEARITGGQEGMVNFYGFTYRPGRFSGFEALEREFDADLDSERSTRTRGERGVLLRAREQFLRLMGAFEPESTRLTFPLLDSRTMDGGRVRVASIQDAVHVVQAMVSVNGKHEAGEVIWVGEKLPLMQQVGRTNEFGLKVNAHAHKPQPPKSPKH